MVFRNCSHPTLVPCWYLTVAAPPAKSATSAKTHTTINVVSNESTRFAGGRIALWHTEPLRHHGYRRLFARWSLRRLFARWFAPIAWFAPIDSVPASAKSVAGRYDHKAWSLVFHGVILGLETELPRQRAQVVILRPPLGGQLALMSELRVRHVRLG